MEYTYDIKVWGRKLGFDTIKIGDAVSIAKDLKSWYMEGKQKKTIAAVTFYLLEGAS